MTGSIETAKSTNGRTAKSAPGDAGKIAKTGDAAGTAAASPVDLLKKAVAGPVAVTAPVAAVAGMRSRMHLAAVATVALVVGTSFGLIAAPRERSGEALARIEASLEAGRAEAGRLNAEIASLTGTIASLRETSEASLVETRAIRPGFADRLARLEQDLDKRFASLAERTTPAEREQPVPAVAPAVAPVEKRAGTPVAASTTTTGSIPATAIPRTDPMQTAGIVDAKPKSDTVEAWALRDVYDGIAMLEDRKRRLIEVAPGDAIPGVGRVEAIERRGRIWTVVTRQGLITPQTW